MKFKFNDTLIFFIVVLAFVVKICKKIEFKLIKIILLTKIFCFGSYGDTCINFSGVKENLLCVMVSLVNVVTIFREHNMMVLFFIHIYLKDNASGG